MLTGLLKVMTMLVGMFVTGLLLLAGGTITFLPAIVVFILVIVFFIA